MVRTHKWAVYAGRERLHAYDDRADALRAAAALRDTYRRGSDGYEPRRRGPKIAVRKVVR